jgi:outer membrane putative beta-barrel porin/alpha-amylase
MRTMTNSVCTSRLRTLGDRIRKKSIALILLALPILILTSYPCSAQTILTPGTVVIGQCNGHTSEPGCVLPNLFGPTGLTLHNSPAFSHFAHFVGSAQTTLNTTLSTAIATQLAILPIISPASGFTYKYDSSAGAFVRTSSSFGPIYTERAETIGRGKISFGASYQRFRFGDLDGINLHNVPAVFTHIPGTGPGGAPEPYEADVIQTKNNIDLNMDQTLLYGTVGITDRLDVSVAIPIVSVRMGVSSDAQIIRVSGPTFTLTPGGRPIPNPHEFNAAGALTNVYTSNGSAGGIGDVTIRVKGNILQTENIRVALAMDVRTPTGNAMEFLGSGAVGVKPFVAISAGKRFSPHLNVGYQWNGDSVLAGNLTGTTVSENSSDQTVVQNGPATKKSLPDQFFYSIGADYGVTSRLTLVGDYLGQTLIDAPRVFRTNYITQNIPGGTGALTLSDIAGGQDTIGLNSAAVGFKLNLFDQLLLTGDLLFRLDNRGLRQDVTPLIALSYAFGK